MTRKPSHRAAGSSPAPPDPERATGNGPGRPVDHEIRAAATGDLDTSFFLEAGAGTGKTRILVERVVEIVRRGAAEIRQVVVITFTEKAAGELRARIRDSLHAEIEHAAEPHRSRCRAALRDLVSAHIETIHAFASSLLREFPLEAGVNPGFQQLDEVASRVDFQEQWDDWIWNVEGPRLAAVEYCLRLGMSLDTVHEVAGILDRHRELRLSGAAARRPDAARVLRRMQDLRTAGDRLAEACTRAHDRGLSSFRTLRDQLIAVEQLARSAPGPRRSVLIEAALHAVWFRPAQGNRRNWRSEEALEEMRALQREARDQLARYQARLNDDALHRLAGALTVFVRNAAAERRRAGKLNFDDLLIEARALVAGNAAVRAALRDRYRFLLVDEFQDTDPLQAEMVFLLAADEPTAAPASPRPSWQEVALRPGKLFIVGDPKQSIYRFRRADIDTYLRAKEVFRRQPDGQARIATVSQNFRSVPEITDWVNATFAAVLRPSAQFPGAQPAYRPIHAYRDAAGHPRVRLMYPAADLHDTKLAELRRDEAAAVTRLIADLVGNPSWQIAAEDSAAGVRSIALRDICILVETRTAVEVYTEALAGHGVPYIVDGGRDFFQHQEINDVASILRAVDDPSDQVSLVAALKSAAFCCSDVDLLQHRIAGGRFSLLGRTFPDTPVGRGLRQLAALYETKNRVTLPFLVDRAIRANFLAEPLLITSRDRQRVANLRAIVDRAAEFAVGETDALRPFVRWLTARQGDPGGERDLHLAETDDDVVRVMTVHGAKGLEFPVVILAKLSAGINHGAARSVVDRDRGMLEFAVGNRDNRFSTPGFAAAAAREQAYGHAEQARLLYVAATRARDLLVVSAFRSEEHPGMFVHLPDLPSWVSVFDGGLRNAPAGARAILDTDLPEARRPAQPAPARFPVDLSDQWRQHHARRTAHLEQGPRYTTPSMLAAEAHKEPRETEPPDRSAPEKDLDRFGDADRALGTADGAAGVAFVGSSAGLRRGSLVHEVLYRCALGDEADAAAWARRLAGEQGVPELADEVKRHAATVINSAAMLRVRSARRVLRELPVAWYDGRDGGDGRYVEGFVDLAFEEADGWVLADYKTDALPAAGPDGVRALQARYRPQLDQYRRAVEAAGMRVAGYGLWLTTTGKLHLW
ncbi:MAG: UvrD-helicase domain-containing protein [Spirochaetaceae bacterium]|nr:UvrD-helicase domain-containing protein [Spirochaetaceae bacterium]